MLNQGAWSRLRTGAGPGRAVIAVFIQHTAVDTGSSQHQSHVSLRLPTDAQPPPPLLLLLLLSVLAESWTFAPCTKP